jgi:hypothetical protein
VFEPLPLHGIQLVMPFLGNMTLGIIMQQDAAVIEYTQTFVSDLIRF